MRAALQLQPQDAGTLHALAEQADELEERMMHELSEKIATKSVLFNMGDGKVEIESGAALQAANPGKYFLMGAFSAAFYLLGTALVFGATGSVSLKGIQAAFADATMAPERVMLLREPRDEVVDLVAEDRHDLNPPVVKRRFAWLRGRHDDEPLVPTGPDAFETPLIADESVFDREADLIDGDPANVEVVAEAPADAP